MIVNLAIDGVVLINNEIIINLFKESLLKILIFF